MRHGHVERLIMNFLEEPASEKLICEVHAPVRIRYGTKRRELHKVVSILERMVQKGLIKKDGNTYRRSV
jgi:hypothetical protein